jgi:hypothetical protein
MKLIVVRRTAVKTYERLRSAFSDDPNVKVVWERRTRERRKKSDLPAPERRGRDDRLFTKPWNDKGYFVIQNAEKMPRTKPPALRSSKDPWSGSR